MSYRSGASHRPVVGGGYPGQVSNEAWRPIIPTGREEALTEAFPGYLREAVFGWLKDQFQVSSGYAYPTKFVEFQNASRTDLGFRSDGLLDWNDQILPHLRTVPDAHFTNLLDYLASRAFWGSNSSHPLEQLLSDGGSAWTVSRWNTSHARLTKRVPDGVREAVSGALVGTDAASAKLQEAWLDAYGTSPRASVAYSHAVVAVETAALTLIPTGKDEPTLASVFSLLEGDSPKWTLIFRDSSKAPNSKTLAMMLRTLWRGHESRHGRPEYTDATLEEARGAVILAATLVQWLTSGVVVPVER